MATDPNLALFAELLHEKNETRYDTALKDIRDEYLRRLKGKWIRAGGSGKFTERIAIDLLQDVYDEFTKPYQERVNAVYEEVRKKKESLNKTLEELAQQIEIYNSADEVTTYSTYHEYSYHTQGYGARTYAKGQADMDAAKCYMIGINSAVVTRNDEHNEKEMVFECRVTTTRIETEVLRYKVGCLTLRDCIKLCLQRCLNPRVYWPMLPWGLEEKLGLDMHGNDIPGYMASV